MNECIKLNPNIFIRNISELDSIDIWNWRLDPYTRKMSINQDDIDLQQHNKWLINSINNSNHFNYIGLIDNNKIGLCRFVLDEEGISALVSININPDFRNKKLSSLLLQKSMNFFNNIVNVELKAIIKKNNIPSIKCFSSCNFYIDYEDDYFYYYKCNSQNKYDNY